MEQFASAIRRDSAGLPNGFILLIRWELNAILGLAKVLISAPLRIYSSGFVEDQSKSTERLCGANVGFGEAFTVSLWIAADNEEQLCLFRQIPDHFTC